MTIKDAQSWKAYMDTKEELAAMTAQRDELLAACKALTATFTAGDVSQHSIRLKAIKSIASIEKGQG